jgi:density-regulated protein DRP1
MAEEGSAPSIAPRVVEYDPITGVPAEFNEYLPKETDEYKKWKAAQEGPEALEKLTLKDKEGNELEKKPGGKVKKKQKPAVVLETNTRNKKKCVTTVHGLEAFGIKLSEASKAFGKKFACGASVTKNAEGKEQIDMQGDFMDSLADLILRNYGNSHGITKGDIYFIQDKRKVPYYGDSGSEGGEDDE